VSRSAGAPHQWHHYADRGRGSLTRSGERRPIEDSASPIRDREGRVSGSIVVFRDVAERRQLQRAEARADESIRLLASIVASSNDAIISKALDGTIRSWNTAAEHIFGYSAAEAVGAHISLILPPDRVQEEEPSIIARVSSGRRLEHFETERRHRDGRLIPVTLTISPIRDEAGNVVGASAIVRDISERKKAEAERQKFVTLVDNSTDFIGICDLSGVPVYINPAGLQMVGLQDMEQARRVHVRDFFLPEDQPRVMDGLFPKVLEVGHAELEVRFRNFLTGATRWMSYKVIALRDANGRATGVATVSQDISERRRMEVTLRSFAAELSENGPPQGRISGDARARTAQSARAVEQHRAPSAARQRPRRGFRAPDGRQHGPASAPTGAARG
jgi:PAS domain S-box-containing protein